MSLERDGPCATQSVDIIQEQEVEGGVCPGSAVSNDAHAYLVAIYQDESVATKLCVQAPTAALRAAVIADVKPRG